jgi:hypothetical protein
LELASSPRSLSNRLVEVGGTTLPLISHPPAD